MRKFLCCAALAVLVLAAGAQVAVAADTNLASQGVGGSEDGQRVMIPGAGSTILWDNGDTDGVNGYSNATVDAFGARRTLLDDFEIPAGEAWTVNDFHWIHVWNLGETGIGTGAELCIHADAGGAPGAEIACATNSVYSAAATGRVWFSRPEEESWIEFDDIVLDEGRYWFQSTIVGPDNNFWLVKDAKQLEECWVNYDDLGGMMPCSQQFGTGPTIDMSWYITGDVVTGCTLVAGTVNRARPGQRIPISMSIKHTKSETVTTPFVVSIEDMDGNVLMSKSTRSYTMEFGKTVKSREQITLPLRMGSGDYNLVVYMENMRGGRQVASQTFTVR